MRIDTTSFKHQVSLQLAGADLFLAPYQLVVDGRTVFADGITCDGDQVEARFGSATRIQDTFTFEPGRITVRRSWSLSGSFGAGLVFSVIRRASPNTWILPGIEYLSLPQGTERSGSAYESACTVPSFLFLEDEAIYFAVFTDPASGAADISSVHGQISSMYAEARIVTPGGDAPHAPPGRRGAELSVQGQLSYERTFYILYGEPGAGALAHALERAWGMLAFEPAPPGDWSDKASARAAVLCERFYVERSDASGFIARLSPGMFPLRPVLEGGGPGGNITAARAMYQVAHATGDMELKRRALDTADFFLDGFEAHKDLCTDYHLGRRQWMQPEPGPDHNARLGAMLYEYLLLHETAKKLGDQNPRWTRACRRWADGLVQRLKPRMVDPLDKVQQAPRTDRGRGALDPSAGWYVAVLAALARTRSGAGYRDAAERLAGALLPLGAEPGWCGPGGPPVRDTALALMRAFRHMHALTRHAEYLDAAEGVAGLLLSYTWAAAARLPSDTPLGRAGLRLSGAVNADPASPRADTGAAAAALEMLRLDALLGGGTFWRRVALAQLEFCAALASPQSAATPWPGCDPTAVSLSGAARGLAPASSVRLLSAITDTSCEFPDLVHVTFRSRYTEKTIKATLGRAVLTAGCVLNRWAR